jgi:predicted O-methyltransferase YrrM
MLPDGIEKLLEQTRPEQDPIQKEMEEYASNHQFPIIGPDVGTLLKLLAKIKNAEYIFEFGSGFGYSAHWFLKGMSDSGQITLTELNNNKLSMARDYFIRTGEIEKVDLQQGDAVDIAKRYQHPVDIVLIDIDKHQYPEAFHAIEGKLKSDSVIVADNILQGPADYSETLDYLTSPSKEKFDSKVEGIGEYLKIATSEQFCTSIIPVGKGVSLTTKL